MTAVMATTCAKCYIIFPVNKLFYYYWRNTAG